MIAEVLVEADHRVKRANRSVPPGPRPSAASHPVSSMPWSGCSGSSTRRDSYRVLAPLVLREIVYRISLGEQRDRLREIPAIGASEQRMSKAIELIPENYDKPLYITRLARKFGMSPSGFHHHFKSATAMSPLQFQKQLRLQEARRLLVADNYDAATAAYRVGYDDPSHFNLEDKRLFGAPPMRDVERLRTPARVRPASRRA